MYIAYLKGFQSKEEWRFPFWHIFFRFEDIHVFVLWQHSWLRSFSVKNQISPFAAFKSGPVGLARNTHGSHIV